MTQSLPRLDPDVVFQRVGDEGVLVHLRTDKIYRLNATGSRLIELLDSEKSVTGLTERLVREFNVGEERVQQDIGDVIGLLKSERLVSSVDD
jgi:hypothetical protein